MNGEEQGNRRPRGGGLLEGMTFDEEGLFQGAEEQRGLGWMTGVELHRPKRKINKIEHFPRQITAKPSKKYANLQPAATRNLAPKTTPNKPAVP